MRMMPKSINAARKAKAKDWPRPYGPKAKVKAIKIWLRGKHHCVLFGILLLFIIIIIIY